MSTKLLQRLPVLSHFLPLLQLNFSELSSFVAGFFWGAPSSCRILQPLRSHSHIVMLESTLTKMLVDVDWENLAPATDDWVEFDHSRVLVQDWSQLVPECWNLRCPFSLVIDLFLSASFIDVCLVLQSDRKFWKCSEAPKYFIVHST